MQTTILGPNLRDQSKGNIHIHKAGCADIKRDRAYRGLPDGSSYTAEYASRREIVEYEYPPEQFQWEDDPDNAMIWSDFWFAPCVADLPKESA